MLHTNFLEKQIVLEFFERFLPYMGKATVLDMRPGCRQKTSLFHPMRLIIFGFD